MKKVFEYSANQTAGGLPTSPELLLIMPKPKCWTLDTLEGRDGGRLQCKECDATLVKSSNAQCCKGHSISLRAGSRENAVVGIASNSVVFCISVCMQYDNLCLLK